jgi:hypothetical protein
MYNGKYPVQNSAGLFLPSILIMVFRDFPQSLLANSETVHQIGNGTLLPNPYLCTIHDLVPISFGAIQLQQLKQRLQKPKNQSVINMMATQN